MNMALAMISAMPLALKGRPGPPALVFKARCGSGVTGSVAAFIGISCHAATTLFNPRRIKGGSPGRLTRPRPNRHLADCFRSRSAEGDW